MERSKSKVCSRRNISIGLAVLVLFVARAGGDVTQHWQQFRAFGGQTLAGDIRSIISDARYVFVFSNSSGARYDKLLNKWEFSLPSRVPSGGFSFTALDHLTGDIYFVQGSKLYPYSPLSKTYNREIGLPATVLALAFDGRGVWVRTQLGSYLCDRWNGKVSAAGEGGKLLDWFTSFDLDKIRNDPRFYGLAPYYIMDDWALVHPLTSLSRESANPVAWVSFSGLGLWQYDIYSRTLQQATRGFLASTNVMAITSFNNNVVMTGQGGITVAGENEQRWQQWGRLFNLDLAEYQLRTLALDGQEMFIGTDRGILTLKAGSDFAGSISSYEGLSYDKINCLWAQDDSLWVGTDFGLSLCLKNSRTVYNLWPALDKYKVHAICGDRDFIYLATDRGGVKLDKTDSLKAYRYDDKSPAEMDGELVSVQIQDSLVWWLGRECLISYNKLIKSWSRYPRAGNYAAGQGQCLAMDSLNIWIGTDNGLVRFIKSRGQFLVYNSVQGLLNDQVWAVCSLNGRLWAGGPDGASRFNWAEEGQ